MELLWLLPLGIGGALILWSERNAEKEREQLREYFRKKQEETFIKVMEDFQKHMKKGP